MDKLSIAKRVTKAREEANMTQEDIAKKMGLTYQAISNYERGRNNIEIKTLIKLCEIYNADIEYILTGNAYDKELDDLNIGENLKKLREKKGLTLEEVGNRIGVTKATVQRYESGEIDIKRKVAIKLAEIYGVTPAQILGWKEQKFTVTSQEQEIIEKYREMPEMQTAILRILGITPD